MSILNPAQRCSLLAYSRELLRSRLAGATEPALPMVGAVLDEPRGIFVTLRAHGELRGCIGTIHPREALRVSLPRITAEAAFDDPRFAPVTDGELPSITIEHSLLTPPQPVERSNAVVLGRHGIILSVHGHRSVFLPEVPVEQGWDLPTTLHFLSRKAGLPGEAWRDPAARLDVFESFHYGEQECRRGAL
jgi:AmmeMemoRadiSam system protein A